MPKERFPDRETAGRRLAAVLGECGYERGPIVLGIPRGGMVLAAEVARCLAAELGVVVSRQLEAPYQPELALGAVTSDGVAYVDSVLAEEVGASRRYLLEEQNRQAEHAKRHQQALDGSRSYSIKGRDVLVVTDGLTSGARAIAATRRAQAAGAARVIVASPVAPPDALEELRREADEVVCLLEEASFLSVAQFYDDFHLIDDETVRKLLEPSGQTGQTSPS